MRLMTTILSKYSLDEYISKPGTAKNDGLYDITALPTVAQVPIDIDALTYIPLAQSRYGESDSSNDISSSSFNYTSKLTFTRDRENWYSLRDIPRVAYSAWKKVATDHPDGPTLNRALKYQQRDEQIAAINE